MNVYRVHLKPGADATYAEVLDFCISQHIIGVGWAEVVGNEDSWDALKQECQRLTQKDGPYPGDKGVFKCVNAIRRIQPGDLIWTREGGSVAKYYLCRATNLQWKDREITAEHYKYDITNYVGCEWVEVGTEDHVPGHVVNSFRARLSAQRVYDVETASAIIWNHQCTEESLKYEVEPISEEDFWNMIGTEELECLVLLYLQTKGYYIYSSTVKKDTKTYEAIMVSDDGKHKCYPQVKQNEPLTPSEYAKGLGPDDKVVLFSSNETYRDEHPQVECLTRRELWDFVNANYCILPDSVKYWVDFVKTEKIL